MKRNLKNRQLIGWYIYNNPGATREEIIEWVANRRGFEKDAPNLWFSPTLQDYKLLRAAFIAGTGSLWTEAWGKDGETGWVITSAGIDVAHS